MRQVPKQKLLSMADRKSKNQEKFHRDVQEVQETWKKFAKDSKRAQEEKREAFDKENSEWTVGRVSTMIVVSGVILAVAVGLLRWLLI